MDIYYLGHASFYLKFLKGTVITDPFSPEMVGLKFPQKFCDIVTVSHDHEDHNNVARFTSDTLVCRYPGEYEKNDIHITGFPSFHDGKNGIERGKNTLFKIESDQVSILHCGDLGHILTQDSIEEIGRVDILMIPVGGTYTINSDEAVKIVQEIEPSYIIPMHYYQSGMNEKIFGTLESVDVFVKKMGVEHVQKVKKLSVKNETLSESSSVVLFDIDGLKSDG